MSSECFEKFSLNTAIDQIVCRTCIKNCYKQYTQIRLVPVREHVVAKVNFPNKHWSEIDIFSATYIYVVHSRYLISRIVWSSDE